MNFGKLLTASLIGLFPVIGWADYGPIQKIEDENVFVIQDHPGGILFEEMERMREIHSLGATVRIIGKCYSACTLWLAYPDLEISEFAEFHFHSAYDEEREINRAGVAVYRDIIPKPIDDILMELGTYDIPSEQFHQIPTETIFELFPEVKL